MKRIKKALILPIRRMAYHWKLLRLYYWADLKLYELRAVFIMPISYYCWLYRACLLMIGFSKFRKLAIQAIHTIPFNVRFELA